jgi:hypothetical protein
MKSRIHTRIFMISVVILMFAGFYALTYTNGPPSGNTNAPGDANCTQCHSGSLVTSGTNWSNITLTSNIPSTGYVPDSVYTMTLSHTQSGITRFGFQLTALKSSGNTKAGTLIVTNSTTTQLLSGTRDYIEQTSAGTSGSGSISWSFNWRAPATNSGDIKFYAAVNASNNNGNSSGDMILAKNFTYSVSSLLPTAIINVSNDTVCVDDTVSLYGSGANSPTTWSWVMKGGTPSTATTQNTQVVYKTAGTYSVTLLTANTIGSSVLATQTILVVAKPTVSIAPAGPVNLCQGDSVALTATAGKSMTYLWNNSKTTAIIYVKTSGTYYCTVTNASGCSQVSKTVTVAVHALPSVTLTSVPDDTICKGTAVQFIANPGNYKNYTFKSGTTILQNLVNNTYITSSLTNGTSVFVTIKDSNNCSATSNSIKTTVADPLDTPKVSCGGRTTSTIEYVWTAVPKALEYEVSEDSGKTWMSPGSGATGLNHQVYGLTYNQSVMLYVRAKDNFPCLYSPVATLTCSSLPCSAITYRFEYDSVLCEGEATSIDLHDINTTSYAIDFENQGFTKDTVYPIMPTATKTYTMLLIDSNALNCPALIFKARIRVSPLPVVSLSSDKTDDAICKGDSMLFTASSGYPNYLFVRNNKDTLQNSTGTIYLAKSLKDVDTFSVIATNKDGCSAPGNDIVVTIYPLPVVGFSYVQNFLQFNFSDTTRNASSWLWDFGDTHTDSIKSPLHTFPKSGLYDVKLSVTDSNGCAGNTVKKVNAFINSLESRTVSQFTVRYIRSQNNIEVNYELTAPAGISIHLLNQSGALVKTIQSANQKQGKYSTAIPANDLKKGVYIIRLSNGSSSGSKKLLID